MTSSAANAWGMVRTARGIPCAFERSDRDAELDTAPSHDAVRGPLALRRGFTLLELLIVMTLIVLLAGIALPQLSASIRRQQANTAATQFARDLQRARVEALKRNDVVFVAKTGTNSYNIRFVGDRYLPENAVFGAGGPDTLRFAPFGPPTTGATTYTIQVSSTTRNVSVSGGGHARVH